MNHRSSAVLCVEPPTTRAGAEAALDDPERRVRALEAELKELEPVVAAAVVTATAFRLRDEAALTAALRALVQALEQLEQERADD